MRRPPLAGRLLILAALLAPCAASAMDCVKYPDWCRRNEELAGRAEAAEKRAKELQAMGLNGEQRSKEEAAAQKLNELHANFLEAYVQMEAHGQTLPAPTDAQLSSGGTKPTAAALEDGAKVPGVTGSLELLGGGLNGSIKPKKVGCETLSAADCEQFNRLRQGISDAGSELASAGAHGANAVDAAALKLAQAQTSFADFIKKHDTGAPSPDLEAGKADLEASRELASRLAPVGSAENDLKNGDPKKALQTIDQAQQNQANDPKLYQLKAQALDALGRHDEAAAAMRRFAQLDPETAKLLEGHGSQLGRAESISSKAKGLSFGETGDPGAGSGAGGSRAGARPGYAQASMISMAAPAPPPGLTMTAPKSPSQVLVEKAWEKLRLGDKTGALLAATAAIDADPKNTFAWTIRAEVENDMGKFPPAELDATQAVSIDAANARAYRARAYAELEDGKIDAALADAQKAVELEPGSGLGYLYRAMALEKLGRGAEALADYQKAVALDPTLHALADDAIARLSGKGAPSSSSFASGSPTRKRLMRGGLIAGSLALVLFGLLGTEAGRRLTTRPARSSSAAAETLVAPARPDLAPGMTLAGNYRLERELGRGGMGVVFEAVDQALQRRVAIKQLQRDGDSERFLQEARLVAKLKHPNLAQIYNVIDDGELYLVFEFVDGQTLDRALALSRKLPPASAAAVLKDVCSGVAYAHSQSIIHRDLKPSNVMLARDGKAKVMDFGVAHQSRSGAALTHTAAAGTPPYMAPEQALGSNSKASDLYALGVMAYEMVTGARPFDGPDFLEQKLQCRFPPATRRDQALPARLDAFFQKALDPDPTRRHGDAASFQEAFSQACLG